MRNTLISLLLLLGLGAGAGSYLWQDYQRFLNAPITLGDQAEALDEPILLEVPRGQGLRALASRLHAEGMLDNAHYFIALAYNRQQANQLKAGEYALKPGMTPPQLLDLLVSGRSVQYPVTLIEGRTFHEVLATIAAAPEIQHKLKGLTDAEIIAALGLGIEHPEGWFFPDTYFFHRGVTDIEVLKRAHARMREVLDQEWSERDPDLPLTSPEEALILASVIEKETALGSERPAIAGVFVRRLQQGMRLQTDPTVIYGLGDDFDGNLTRADLETDSPYNTYTRAGLPPTPIALAGREAIHAALHPQDGDSLYFVARGDGSHYFSASLAEHNCAVQRFQRNGHCDLSRFQ
ncbi:endolytic transglycosylase MltG [Rhabdochromatium marinum]|uniref:endolytic transglycosylase MltG n=1 Tax=Rhabdochromatium marinum TaxID=48729 RepID=UPI00190497CA|nr:endolytic transglycosylase MltG [Rhabdochromatium marinum]MBK1649093.1 aminodeoxychorismate lyase [Rhabdochromatium marinum]